MTVANFSGGDFCGMSEYFASVNRAVVQLGRTLEWGSRGRGFKSRQPEISNPQMNPRIGLIGLIICSQLAAGRAQANSVRLNPIAFDFARNLISQGRFVDDKRGNWKRAHPNRNQQNDFIRDHGFAEYAQWYLAIDERHPSNSKARYKFPFGDFRNVHRCGLLAVKARAHAYGYDGIEAAATKLLEMIESVSSPRGQKRID